MIGTDQTTFERLERSYNKCLRAIYGRGEGLLTNSEIQKTLKIPSLSEQVDYHDIMNIMKIIITKRPITYQNLLKKLQLKQDGLMPVI